MKFYKFLIVILMAAAFTGCETLNNVMPGQNQNPPSVPENLSRHLNSHQATIKATVNEIYKSSLGGIKDLGLRMTTNQTDLMSAKIECFLADGTPVVITINDEPNGWVTLNIRCGTMGDAYQANTIYHKILKNYKKYIVF